MTKRFSKNRLNKWIVGLECSNAETWRNEERINRFIIQTIAAIAVDLHHPISKKWIELNFQILEERKKHQSTCKLFLYSKLKTPNNPKRSNIQLLAEKSGLHQHCLPFKHLLYIFGGRIVLNILLCVIWTNVVQNSAKLEACVYSEKKWSSQNTEIEPIQAPVKVEKNAPNNFHWNQSIALCKLFFFFRKRMWSAYQIKRPCVCNSSIRLFLHTGINKNPKATSIGAKSYNGCIVGSNVTRTIAIGTHTPTNTIALSIWNRRVGKLCFYN